MTEYKTPKRLKGFQDFFAYDLQIRNFVIDTFRRTFEKYGYEPLETPALEYSELILGQSGEEAEKQYYRFEDQGGRDVMLKFEVMISMCRALAQNINNIPLPYKRYQIQRVWRAEKVQKGRYREFTQCDADTIGSDSMDADAEFIKMGIEIVGKLGFKEYIAKISNKKFLDGLAEYLNIPVDKYYGFQMSVDKLYKIGKEGVIKELVEQRSIPQDTATKALDIIDPTQFEDKSFRQTVESFKGTIGSTKTGAEGLKELTEILDYFEDAGVDNKYYKFDTTIARGLASYTGPVCEFEVLEGGVGSIAGGGRFDKAIGKYLGNKDVPATGGSFGIERICDIMKERNMTNFGETTTDVLVTMFDENTKEKVLKVANTLRENNINTMVYPEFVKLDKQFKYADRKDIPWTIVIGSEEAREGTVTLKNMKSREQYQIPIDEAVKKIKSN